MPDYSDLAIRLASCAKEASRLLEDAGDSAARALCGGIGVPEGGMLRSALAQSLIYGLFSAWEAQGRPDSPDWRSSPVMFGRPPDAALFAELGLDAPMDRACEALARSPAPEGADAVEHMYPAFLKEFDPEAKVDLGVFYTPSEIVRYQVARADHALRDLGAEGGFADPRVRAVDPCCGTGAYVMEVLRTIAETAGPARAKEAALERVAGFEIMPAPFLAAQWRIGEFLAKAGAPLAMDERPRIMLASAMPEGDSGGALDLDMDGAILAAVGNPPYNAYAGTPPPEIVELVRPYAERARAVADAKRVNMNDLFVRFFRVAELLAQRADRAVVSFIANHSWVASKSFAGMRSHLMETFDRAWIDEMSGSVFRIAGFAEGVKQGVAIGMLAKGGGGDFSVLHRSVPGGEAAREALAADSAPPYRKAEPGPRNFHSFAAFASAPGYLSWPDPRDLCASAPGCHSPGAQEGRSGSLFGIDRDDLAARMRDYFDPGIGWAELARGGNGLALPKSGYGGEATRERALRGDSFSEDRILRYSVRPFDVQWAYRTEVPNVWNSLRRNLWRQADGNDRFMISRGSQKGPQGIPMMPSRAPCDLFFMSSDSFIVPLHNHVPADGMLPASIGPNLSETALAWLESLGGPGGEFGPDDPWLHALAVCCSPEYISANADCLAMAPPRIPLPRSAEALRESATLGRFLTMILEGEEGIPVPESRFGLSFGSLCAGPPGGSLSGWGSVDREGSVHASHRVLETRPWTEPETETLRGVFSAMDVDGERGFELLGDAADVPFAPGDPDSGQWTGIPSRAWECRIGRYRAIRKWLSYRDRSILGRAISGEEAEHVTAMARRISILLLMTDRLDASYRACRDDAWEWPG